jgi:16S rRNA G966 N2-methylase RsmD
MRYLMQCVAGMQGVAARQLAREGFGALRFRLKEEGLLVFEAEVPPRDLCRLGYANNCFLVLKTLRPRPQLDISARLKQLLQDRDWRDAAGTRVREQERTFRLRLSDESRPVAGETGLVRDLTRAVAEATGLRPSPLGADSEFWVIRRRSGWACFAKRITVRSGAERDQEKGELRPELAHLLCLMSEPSEEDVFLDPFAGSGAIPFARTAWPCRQVLAFDRDQAKVRAMRRAVGRRSRSKCQVSAREADARRLTMIGDESVDKVVTDPPWGWFDQSEGYSYRFYESVVQELARVTRPGGVIVLLLGEESVADQLAATFAASLKVQSKLGILVSGRKAVVLKWTKTQPSAPVCGEAALAAERNPGS